MPRIKLNTPEHFIFETTIAVRITDLNYGAHMGNDALLSLIHEARVQFFKAIGASELDLFGTSVIMGDVAIVYKSEGFYADNLLFRLAVNDFTTYGFDIVYYITKNTGDEQKDVAIAKTGMVCFNYEERKIQPVPQAFIDKVQAKIK